MPKKYESVRARIEANSAVVEPDVLFMGVPCRLWTGATSTNRSGMKYGKFSTRFKRGPRKGKVKTEGVHRVVVRKIKGRRLTTRMVVRHCCNNTLCVEPEHLFGGTQKQNVRQCVADGRHRNQYTREGR